MLTEFQKNQIAQDKKLKKLAELSGDKYIDLNLFDQLTNDKLFVLFAQDVRILNTMKNSTNKNEVVTLLSKNYFNFITTHKRCLALSPNEGIHLLLNEYYKLDRDEIILNHFKKAYN